MQCVIFLTKKDELANLREEANTLMQLFKEIDEEKHREKELEEEFKLKKEVSLLLKIF